MTQNVVVIGGGYGGIAVAKALDDIARVTLVEPREAFVHNVAALRAVVDPAWQEKIFIPYGGLLAHGSIRRDRATLVSATSVELASGDRLPADYVVLATGSSGPFPAKIEDPSRGGADLARLRDNLLRASHVLLLGAGAVGLEMAGEITSAWPGKTVTVVDPGSDLLAGRFPAEFRGILRDQLSALGVHLKLGSRLRTQPEPEAGSVRPFTVTTDEGEVIAADLWLPCFGGSVDTGYLDPALAAARQPDGRLAVTPQLNVFGQDRVYAVGDVTAVPEMKMARNAGQHAEVVAANVRARILGQGDPVAYEPAADAIVLPLGPAGGASYEASVGVLGAADTARFKSTFYLERYREMLGTADSLAG
ncbi:NADH dehydrogenase FAD-containing subunit [Actinoplanes lutulentus]|uniref:NADH dehydrogenase FAD-containing subunit n=1 Tax=Actinoplanes lutulentus TaxID=1287878 RepID=A0A327ZHL3_9ACTN|nr:FAD-dependent oxidoreductase [Actinoplanes lutulentus]MBB2945585.1 NADH dehydrogenase FAD-containing subunit [Actinoplanes lutulentus]RAK40283.1 NADH dehydrogenase FAD-containing subunit [Actinoplanes lutulentus]